MKIIGMFLLIAIPLFMIYMFAIVYTNGCDSKYRKFRIISYYYDNEKRENHVVYWKLFLVWHAYIIDSHYMDVAEFTTKQEAIDFIENLDKKVKPRIEVYEYN